MILICCEMHGEEGRRECTTSQHLNEVENGRCAAYFCVQLNNYGCGAVSSFAASDSVPAFIIVVRMFTMLSVHKFTP
jgi:hypothetical protein